MKKLSHKRKILIGTVIALLLILLSVGILFLVNTLQENVLNHVFLYVKNDTILLRDLKREELRLVGNDNFKPLMEIEGMEQDPFTEWNSNTYLTKNGALLFPMTSPFSNPDLIYWKWYTEEKPKIPAKQVRSYVISKDERLLTYVTSNGELCQYNLKTDMQTVISNDIEPGWCISPDGKRIVFQNGDKNLMYCVEGKTKEIRNYVTSFAVSEDFKTLYYVTDGILYRLAVGDNPEEIDTDVDEILCCEKKDRIYYIKKVPTELNLRDFVDDDMAEIDRKPENMVIPPEPKRENYATEAEFLSARQEFRDALSAYFKATGDAIGSFQRDRLREAIETETLEWPNHTLCYYDGETTRLVEEYDVFNIHVQTENTKINSITYQIQDPAKQEKIKLSSVQSMEDLKQKIIAEFSIMSQNYLAAHGEKVQLPENTLQMLVTNDGTMFYYFVPDQETTNVGKVYRRAISKKGIGEEELFAEDVSSDTLLALGDNHIAYFKDVPGQFPYAYDEACGELYFDGEKVTENVAMHSLHFQKETKSLYFLTAVDPQNHAGTLQNFKKGKIQTIAENTVEYRVLPNGQVLYLKNYDWDKGAGELYILKKKQSTKLEEDVCTLICPKNDRVRF